MTTGTHWPDWTNAAGSVTAAVWELDPAPNAMPPAAGRTTVCTTSLTLSTPGILSATSSSARSTPSTIRTQPFSSHSHPAGRVIRSVHRASAPTTSSGM